MSDEFAALLREAEAAIARDAAAAQQQAPQQYRQSQQQPVAKPAGAKETDAELEARLKAEHDARVTSSADPLRRPVNAPPLDPALALYLEERFRLGHRDPISGQWSRPNEYR
jgi:soluble lytic murein transglycosylase-like protein